MLQKARFKRAAMGLVGLLMGVAFIPESLAGYPGKVILKNGEVRWGQYKNVSGVRAIEYPGSDPVEFAGVLKEWPLSGASAAILRCQKPGKRFFTGDGSGIVSENVESLRDMIVTLNSFDMLPIVHVFDPSISCQLDSSEAYPRAARTLVRELGDDGWYLLCLSDSLDHPDWFVQVPDTDPIQGALEIAESLKEKHPDLIIAAGATDPAKNAGLFEEGGPVDVLMRRVESLASTDSGVASDRAPVIEIVPSERLTSEDVEKVVKRVGFRRIDESFSYGFGVVFENPKAILEGVRSVQEMLSPVVDSLQKEVSNAIPPSTDMNATLDPEEAKEGFVSLFNGKDLAGWVPITQPENFMVKDETIQIQKFKGGWLRSWEPYEDFIFRGEYWIEEGGNSGMFFRAPLVGRCSRIGFEFQVMGQDKDAPITNDVTGSIYDVKPPDGVYIRPGEWNEVEIQCVGPTVKIVWNGEVAHDFEYQEVEAMKNRAVAGYIGLQDHYNEVKFRNLRVKKLN